MPTIFDLKEQQVVDTPLILFDCVFSGGQEEHWSTHEISLNGTKYEARVLQHSAFEIQTASDQGVDGSPTISVSLANADSHFSEIQQSIGFKGARLTASFLFYNLKSGSPATDAVVIFQGICNPPDTISEAVFRVSAGNRMNLQRLSLPPVRIQKRCPWDFPATTDQRTEAVNGGANGKYSRFYRCGYSADIAGGTGLLTGDTPFISCGYTRPDCQARGMWNRFGGLEFVPPVISVRSYGKDWSSSAVSVNQARYNSFVPMVYGTAWYNPPIVFSRNDGNLTRMEVLLGVGQMQGILQVLVNDIEIPLGITGKDMTGTGWYNVPTLGTRNGGFDLNFLDGQGQPAGDPYGSMAYLVVVIPTRLNNGSSLPTVKVLAQGLQLPAYKPDGTYSGDQFSSNPAWILLDILRRCGWTMAEIDIVSFANAAAFCDGQIAATDLNGNPIQIPRFESNLVLQNRRSGGDVVRGIRNAARLYLTYGSGGVLQLQVENTIALQQPTKPLGSNSTEPLNGGWPAYEFGDGSNGFGGILRRADGTPSVALRSRRIADTPNSISVEFQDSLNFYQQDSFSIVDPDDISLAGQEVSTSLMALGLPNYDQAARILKFNCDKSVRGNLYIAFDTSVKGLGVRPGDIITITYLKEGLERQPFRVVKISPATNYRTATITAQLHDDAWYADTNGQTWSAAGSGYSPTVGIGVPKPLLGSTLDEDGTVQFGIVETAQMNSDGTISSLLTANFFAPNFSSAAGPSIPLISLACTIGSNGTLAASQTLYYALAALDGAGNESSLSFVVAANIQANNSTVTLSGFSFGKGTAAFQIYRGVSPTELFLIAANQPMAMSFTDTGFPIQLKRPADPNFDHANFYWRMEQQPECTTDIHSVTTIGNTKLSMGSNAWEGMLVRITRGRGAGQERSVSGNDGTTLTVTPSWSVEPDSTSSFVVAEAGWHFGAQTKTSPVQFSVPNYGGQTVEITGRAANVNDIECNPLLSTVTRWQIAGSGMADAEAPAAPGFGLDIGQAGGTVELSGISFSDLTNTRSISAATLTLHYWDELQPAPSLELASAISVSDEIINLNSAGSAQPNRVLQIDSELLMVTAVLNGGAQYQVMRGTNGSAAANHAAGSVVYQLFITTSIAPFPPDFFGSPYSGNWSYPVSLPDVRIAGAELFVTNTRGNSPVSVVCLTGVQGNGLRTLSGGQYCLQVQGYLAIDQNAAPPLVIEKSHSVRDIFGILGKAGGRHRPSSAKGQRDYPGSDLTILIRL